MSAPQEVRIRIAIRQYPEDVRFFLAWQETMDDAVLLFNVPLRVLATDPELLEALKLAAQGHVTRLCVRAGITKPQDWTTETAPGHERIQ